MTHQDHPVLKAAVTSACTLVEQATGGLFLENMKMERQRTSLPYTKLVRDTLRQGIAGFEAGLWPWGVILSVTKGAVLGYSRAKLMRACETHTHWSASTISIASGFGAGAIQGACMSPVILAIVRVNKALSEKTARGVKVDWMSELKLSAHVLRHAVRQEGPRVLLSGMGPFVVKRSIDWGVRFACIEAVQSSYVAKTGRPPTSSQKLNAILTGAFVSVFVSMPLDRIIPVLQGGSNQSPLAALRTKLKAEGASTLFRGAVFRCLQTGWHTVFTLFVADAVMDAILKRKST